VTAGEDPRISFVIPAYNEEALVGRSLDSVLASARAIGRPFEVIVVNDGSSDRTAEIARARGAAVIDVSCRQIAAARNAGARAARGEVLVFVDADTCISEGLLQAMLKALDRGAVGGGARVEMEGVSWSWRVAMLVFVFFYMKLFSWAAGCFVFARRAVFQAIGGFDERLFASEEIDLSRRLKRQGRFVILTDQVITSGRKARMNGWWGIIGPLLRFCVRGPSAFHQREGLDLWYDGRREEPAAVPGEEPVRSPPPGPGSPSGNRSRAC
jgi:glycosyltransferase involved in cell wall biosynthesis